MLQSGISEEQAAKLKERRTKDELIGKITEQTRRLGKEVPFGLATASVDALRKHLALLKEQAVAKAAKAGK